MNMKHWLNDTEREKRKYSEKILSHNFSTKNPFMDCPGRHAASPPLETSVETAHVMYRSCVADYYT